MKKHRKGFVLVSVLMVLLLLDVMVMEAMQSTTLENKMANAYVRVL